MSMACRLPKERFVNVSLQLCLYYFHGMNNQINIVREIVKNPIGKYIISNNSTVFKLYGPSSLGVTFKIISNTHVSYVNSLKKVY